jgi:hypothetical protein
MGFEPTTSSLGSWHSTTELRPHPAKSPISRHYRGLCLPVKPRPNGLSGNWQRFQAVRDNGTANQPPTQPSRSTGLTARPIRAADSNSEGRGTSHGSAESPCCSPITRHHPLPEIARTSPPSFPSDAPPGRSARTLHFSTDHRQPPKRCNTQPAFTPLARTRPNKGPPPARLPLTVVSGRLHQPPNGMCRSPPPAGQQSA